MKKHTLIPALAAALLCMGAVTLAACGGDTTDPKDTESSAVSESVSESDTAVGTETVGATDTTTEAESETDPETDDESAAESAGDTTAESGTETAEVTESETEGETEAVTAAPRYDYFEAEILPDVTIDKGAYTDMTLELPADLQITDADVLEYIEYIRFDYRVATNGTTQVKDQPLKLGDDAFIYYKGMLDGEEFEGGSNWDDTTPYQLGLGSGSFIPGFESGLVGVIPANATKEAPFELHVTFPENYSADLAGKAVIFYVAVEYAVQYDLPEYTRDFVENTLKYEAEKDFYASDRAYLDEFEGFIRSYLEEEIAADVENAKINALWEHLTDAATCRNHPQLELDFYYNNYVSEIEYYYEYYKMYGGSEFTKEYPTIDDFAPVMLGTEEGKSWKDDLKELSRNLVEKDMISHAIAEAEGIEVVTDEEYKAELKYWVDQYQGYMTEAEILQSMGETALRESAFAAKIQTWLLERVTFTFETVAE